MVPYKVERDGDHVAVMAQGKKYTPPEISALILQKLKKAAGAPTLEWRETPDILLDAVARRHAGQVIVGFAAETTDVEANALAKLRRKRVDLLVVNDVSSDGAGFEHPTNEVTLMDEHGVVEHVSSRSKEAVSLAILSRVATLLSQGAS